MKLSLQALLVGSGLLAASSADADVILHAFNWDYSEITAKATEIQQAGYKMVLIAPPMKSSGNEWWARYQPQDLRLIDHPRGNKQQLQTLIQTLTSKGIEVYADVVLNHMANESAQRNDLNYPGSAVLSSYQANWTYANNQKLFGDLSQNFLSGSDFHAPACISNYLDVWQVQNYRLCGGGGDAGLPDLDNNNWVISQQQAYLQALKNMGIKGFRVDAVKHMSNAHINSVFTPALISSMHVFGEVITSGGSGNQEYELFLKPYLDNTSHSAYDFPLFASMRNAFSFGGSMDLLVDPGAYGQALAWNKAITFAITHDIPTNDGFRYQIMNSTDETLAHAYILGRNGGTPMIYSDHGETANLDGYRWQDFYKRADIKNMIRFHNSTQGSGMQVLGSGQCFLLFKRDKKGIVGINKCNTPQEYWVDTYANELNWYVNYTDVISGNTFQVNTQWLKVTIPPRSARMWLQQ